MDISTIAQTLLSSQQQDSNNGNNSNATMDIQLLDQLVAAAYDPHHSQRNVANQALMQLLEIPTIWQSADSMIEQAQNPNTRFFGLQVLDQVIQTRWNILPSEQKEGIKNFVVGKIISLSSTTTSTTDPQDKVLLHKMNLVLVEILKHEWPHHWPTFISDLVGSSKTSESLCENNLHILLLLSEEVFDQYSKDQMTTTKVKRLKESLNGEFAHIFGLCEFVLSNSNSESLLQCTLQTLQRFLTWIPLGFIFQTPLMDVLVNKFLSVPQFRNDTLDCLTEIATLQPLEAQYHPLIRQLLQSFLERLATIVPPDTNLSAAYSTNNEQDQVFLQKLALFLSGMVQCHLHVLEEDTNSNVLQTGLWYLVRISEIQGDTETLFRIALDAWHMLAEDLYKSEHTGSSSTSTSNGGGVLNLNSSTSSNQSRKFRYAPILSGVRQVMIAHMAKPEEVLVVEDENGDIVRATLTQETDVLQQYKTMKETLVYLTHLNPEDTESIMLSKLTEQVDGTSWSWNNLNTLCWAIGSISGSMSEDEEKRFLVTVIKDLLGLCEAKRGKDNKAVVASNIMYVVGQYPRFLKAHWKFLKTVVNKLFEFMHEVHPGVQDMACDTFLKICQKCKRKFVTLQADERTPFIVELIDSLPSIVSDLEPHQVQAFYEAVGIMLNDKGMSGSSTTTVNRQELLSKLMELPNRTWRMMMDQASQTNGESLVEPATIKEGIKILKTNHRLCQSVGGSLYLHQLQTFFMDLLNVYKVYSERISLAVQQQGEIATRMSLVRSMRSAKKEILRLLQVFIATSGPPDASPHVLAQGFIPPVLDPILGDYRRNLAGARDPEVLALFATIVDKLQQHVVDHVPQILEAVFECTLTMITANFEDFPEHRIRFFELLKSINQHCFPALFNIPPEHQKLVVHSIVWAMKHTERNISDTGLEILHELLQNVGRTPHIAQAFYQQYLLSLIQDVFAVLTDRLHKSGFKLHATLLRHMFHLVQRNQVTVPLFDVSTQPPGQTNPAFLREHISNLLLTSFANLTKPQVANFVNAMLDLNMDLPSFKTQLRDFLIELKEFQADDNNDALYAEEQELRRQQELQQLQAQRANVPGMVKPSEQIDNDL